MKKIIQVLYVMTSLFIIAIIFNSIVEYYDKGFMTFVKFVTISLLTIIGLLMGMLIAVIIIYSFNKNFKVLVNFLLTYIKLKYCEFKKDKLGNKLIHNEYANDLNDRLYEYVQYIQQYYELNHILDIYHRWLLIHDKNYRNKYISL